MPVASIARGRWSTSALLVRLLLSSTWVSALLHALAELLWSPTTKLIQSTANTAPRTASNALTPQLAGLTAQSAPPVTTSSTAPVLLIVQQAPIPLLKRYPASTAVSPTARLAPSMPRSKCSAPPVRADTSW
jgi:hypothetical protein